MSQRSSAKVSHTRDGFYAFIRTQYEPRRHRHTGGHVGVSSANSLPKQVQYHETFTISMSGKKDGDLLETAPSFPNRIIRRPKTWNLPP